MFAVRGVGWVVGWLQLTVMVLCAVFWFAIAFDAWIAQRREERKLFILWQRGENMVTST